MHATPLLHFDGRDLLKSWYVDGISPIEHSDSKSLRLVFSICNLPAYSFSGIL